MNKEELMLVIKNGNGLAISNECNVSTGKIILNGIEITDEKSWNKAIVSLNELEKENQQLEEKINKAIKYIEETPIGSILEVHCGEEEEYTKPLLKILKGDEENDNK